MTTIAYDGLSLAADGMATCDDLVTDLDYKKIQVIDGTVYAVVGCAPILDPLVAWYRRGHPHDAVPKCDADGWTLLVCREGGVLQLTESRPYPDVFKAPWAWGTGRLLALGAMAAGKNAEQAVRIACQRDVYSGGEIQVVSIPGVLLQAAE